MSWRETEIDNFLDEIKKIKLRKLKTPWGRFRTLKKLTLSACKHYDNEIYRNEGVVPVPGVMFNRESGLTALAIFNLDTDNYFDIDQVLILTPHGSFVSTEKTLEAVQMFDKFFTFEYWYMPITNDDRHIQWDACPKHIRKMYDKIYPKVSMHWA